MQFGIFLDDLFLTDPTPWSTWTLQSSFIITGTRQERWINIRRCKEKSTSCRTAAAALSLTPRCVLLQQLWFFSCPSWLLILFSDAPTAHGHGSENGGRSAGGRESAVDQSRQGLQIQASLCSSGQKPQHPSWHKPSSGSGHVVSCKLQQEHSASSRYSCFTAIP